MDKEHYKYMPKEFVEKEMESRGEEPPVEILEVEEEAVIIEEPAPAASYKPEPPAEEEDASADSEPPLWAACLGAITGPLTIPTIASLLIFLTTMLNLIAPGAALPYTLTVFGATCIVPLLTIMVLIRIQALSGFEMPTRQERIIPYIVEFLALGGVTLFLVFKGANPWIWTIYCGGAAAALANFLINFRMRISSRCTAIAGLLAAILVINKYGIPQMSMFWWIVGTVLVAGFLGTMAMLYGRHSLREVLAGYATGFLGVILFSLIH